MHDSTDDHADPMTRISGGLASHQRQELDAVDMPAWVRVVDAYPARDVLDVWENLLATSTEYLKPGHLRSGIIALRQSRIRDAGDPPTPAVDPDRFDNYREWITVWRRAVGDGHTAEVAQEIADEWAREHQCYEPRLRGEPVTLPPTFLAALRRATSSD